MNVLFGKQACQRQGALWSLPTSGPGRALFTKGVAGREAKAGESVISFPTLNINQESSANLELTRFLSPSSLFPKSIVMSSLHLHLKVPQ